MQSALWQKAVVSAIKERIVYVNIFASRRCFFNFSKPPREMKEQKYTLLKTINSSPDKVYDVVSEVSKYQEFIPYCVESFVNKRCSANHKPIEAGLRVGFRQYDEKFTCEVVCQEVTPQYKVIANSISHNLFYLLYGEWTIVPHPKRPSSTQVELLLRFKFKSRLYNSVSSIFAKSVTEIIMKAFERRVFDLQRAALAQGLRRKQTPSN